MAVCPPCMLPDRRGPDQGRCGSGGGEDARTRAAPYTISQDVRAPASGARATTRTASPGTPSAR